MTYSKEKIQEIQEDKEKVKQIAMEIIDPGLQKILADARQAGSAQEVISALANCYGGILVDLMGRKAAATFMQGHALHVSSVED